MRKFSLTAAALAMGASALVPTASADAQRYYGHRYERAYDNAYDDGYNRGPRYGYDRSYRGDRGYYRSRRCKSGDTGTIVGAIAGGLLGRTIDSRGDRTVGTLGGAVLGGLAGRSIERSDQPRYCR